MLGAAMGVLGGSSGGMSTEGGLSGIIQRLQQRGLDRQSMTDSYTNPAAAVVGAPAGLAPNIPMSDSYNVAASSPVFPPATQDQASALFGSQNERQGSTSGFKQEVKERIMTDLNSL
tara:strand:+ start:1955 stop:2305 length:351 start_codon:yes stop_codon:yes gene_type:complete